MPKKILYVEDEPDIQAIAQIALETVGGFSVKVCSSGEQALQEVGGFAPDIVLLDVMMPGMDGVQTFQKLRQKPGCASLPVVFMTARVQSDEIKRYRDLGAVDVIAKPFDAMALPGQVQAILNILEESNSAKQLRLKQQLDALGAVYLQELPSKMAAIKADWQCLKTQFSEQLFNSLLRKTHSLNGSGATFELPALSTAAHALEDALRAMGSHWDGGQTENADTLNSLVGALEQVVLGSLAEDPCALSPAVTPPPANISCQRVILVCDNSAEAAGLRAQLAHFAVRTELVESGQDLAQKFESTDPDVILIEGSAVNGMEARVDKMAQIKGQLLVPATLMVVSADDTMESRLSAVKNGASAYFHSPVKPHQLVEFIRLYYTNDDSSPYRVLIIDDDVRQAEHTALLIGHAGMTTCVVSQPLKALDTLASFQPDLILMDLHMPECSGLELAAVIRQYCNYTAIAIVFFSMDNDIDRHIDALRAGGDEFIVKTASPARIVANVEARAKRSRIIQRLMLRDGLTGLLNRSSIEEHLRLEAEKVKRLSGYFSYVILDLDHFKQINDRYGHLAGDDVLKALGLLLLQRLRTIDLVGRYGGEEIVLILPGTGASQAQHLVNELLSGFNGLKFMGKDTWYSVTFSAGIAEFPAFNHLDALTEAADQALYRAKREGRNRVCIAAVTGS